ncbi:P-loop containing nucleoside triphosphate hydrolase protein [Nemania sp. NC0429]|nr:P-loop containing nucleoside triphosphate hydrolase protein [Nemania sp. NC0429]
MDPLSITAGAIALLGVVGKTIVVVTSFIRGCREACTDLTAVYRELLELQIVLELLRDDSDINESSINTVLEKHDDSKSTPVKWVASGKREVSSLKMSPEAHRGSLNLALEMINISVSKSVKEDTTVIRSDVAGIKQDTTQIAQILEELATLREIVANIRSSRQAAGSNYILQQYLDSLTSYAETVVLDDLTSSDNYSVSVGSRRSSLDHQKAAPGEMDASSDDRRDGSEIGPEEGHKMGMMPTAHSFPMMDVTSSHEPAEEDHTPGTHILTSNITTMFSTLGALESEPGDSSRAPSGQQSQGISASDETKRLICVGDGFVGKTAFLIKSINFTVHDTPGEEEFERLRASAYREKDVVLICFSIGDPDSFENVGYAWKREVLHYCHETPYILVGLKKDLRFDPETLNDRTEMGEKPVTTEMGEDLRKEIGAVSYIECSAKTSEGINDVFYAAARAMKSKRKARWSRLFKKV